MLDKNSFLGVEITNETADRILEYLLQRLKSDEKFYIVTPNPEILVYANSHKNYKNILNFAEIALADGTGLFLASIFMGKPFKQRIPGVEFLEFICKRTVRSPISMGFLGGKGGVAERTVECLSAKYPWLQVVFVGEEWNGLANGKWQMANGKKEKLYAISNKPSASIDLLFVAFGHPKQEEWIYNNLDKLPVKAAMGVGGAFDYISGQATRAPWLVRAIGFEWLFRLFKEPWRFKRQLALFTFVKLVFKERFASK